MNNHVCKAKDIKTGEWVSGYYVKKIDPLICCCNYHFILCQEYQNGSDILNSMPTWHQVKPHTLCQHIGWNDTDGIPIYENDIVEFSVADISYRYLVWWNRESNMMTAVPLDGIRFNGFDYYNNFYRSYEEFCLMMINVYGDYRSIKVIGNIFDNTELMKDVHGLD